MRAVTLLLALASFAFPWRFGGPSHYGLHTGIDMVAFLVDRAWEGTLPFLIPPLVFFSLWLAVLAWPDKSSLVWAYRVAVTVAVALGAWLVYGHIYAGQDIPEWRLLDAWGFYLFVLAGVLAAGVEIWSLIAQLRWKSHRRQLTGISG